MNYRLDKDESRRYDAMKALMCVFVMMIHAFSDDFENQPTSTGRLVYDITLIISRMICDCAVPMFILMSAVLLYAKPIHWWKNLKKKARSLLIPYFIFNTLWIVCMYAKAILGKKLGYNASDAFDPASYTPLQWVDAYLGVIYTRKPILSVLWYVRDLFLLNLLAPVIKKMVDLLPIPMLLLTLVMWIFGFPASVVDGNVMRCVIISDYALCFFIWGYYLVKYRIHFQDFEKLNRYVVWLVYVALLVADVLLRRNEITNRLFILISVVFFIRFSGTLAKGGRLLDWIAPANFFLYLTHRFVYAPFQMITGTSLVRYGVGYLLKPLTTLVVMVPLFFFMKRFTPGFLSLLLGGRAQKTQVKQ